MTVTREGLPEVLTAVLRQMMGRKGPYEGRPMERKKQ